ncbi:MAG: hypothetical protein M3394_02880 [Actinomycetota bacterium]|nr:hypothetical protein [Actinomycetota bacterium]
MKRFAKPAILAVGLLGLLGTNVPAAHAQTVVAVVFMANVNVSGGVGYPVLTLPVPPTVGDLECLPLAGGNPALDAIPNCHLDNDEHPSAVVVSSNGCVDATVSLSPPDATAGACVFQGGGYVEGHCGLGGGQLTLTFTFSNDDTYTTSFHFTDVGGVLVLTGHVTGGGTNGLFVGAALAVPPTPLTPGQSCLNKTANDFLFIGVGAALSL